MNVSIDLFTIVKEDSIENLQFDPYIRMLIVREIQVLLILIHPKSSFYVVTSLIIKFWIESFTSV